LVTTQRTERGWRRSIYAQQRRATIPTILDSFDFPQMAPNCIERGASTVAPQALQLMNDGWVHLLCRRFAERVIREAGADPVAQIDRTYLHALARMPTSDEQEAALAARAQLTRHWSQSPGASTFTLEAVTARSIVEIESNKVAKHEHMCIRSLGKTNTSRRYGLVEFDLSPIAALDIHKMRLELSPQKNKDPIRQRAGYLLAGVDESPIDDNVVTFDTLGKFELLAGEGEVGKYVASEWASPQDIELLKSKSRSGRKHTLVLMPTEDGETYERDWDDGTSSGSHGNRPRLVIERGNLPDAEASTRALTNICHALVNSAEFIYVD
jgi:hypothetical protein